MSCFSKIVLAGNTNVGKSTLVRSLVGSDAPVELTVGCDLTRLSTPSDQCGKVVMHLWDTAGSERFRSIVPAYFRRAHIVLLVEDEDDSCRQSWMSEIAHANPECAPRIVVVKNKVDLYKPRGEFDYAVSASTGEGIRELVTDISEWALASHNCRGTRQSEPPVSSRCC